MGSEEMKLGDGVWLERATEWRWRWWWRSGSRDGRLEPAG
jgi:hypothetical protein